MKRTKTHKGWGGGGGSHPHHSFDLQLTSSMIFVMMTETKWKPAIILLKIFRNDATKVLNIQQTKTQSLLAHFPILQTHSFLHVMIRWVIQMICFDFKNTQHVIARNFSIKLHGRFICHIWLKYSLCITILTFLIYVYSMFHLQLLLPLYSSLMIKAIWNKKKLHTWFFSTNFTFTPKIRKVGQSLWLV